MDTSRPQWVEAQEEAIRVLLEHPSPRDRAAQLLESYTGRLSTFSQRQRAAENLLAASREGYIRAAFDAWRTKHPAAPDWMLPILAELPEPHELGGRNETPAPRHHYRAFLNEERDRQQPDLDVADATFPSAAHIRPRSDVDSRSLSEDEQAAYRNWFHHSDAWHQWSTEDLQALDRLVRQPLLRSGLVWRQHKIRVDLDEIDLTSADPGSTFTLPYPAATRTVATPMGSICRPLPDREHVRSGGNEPVVYLEIWVRTGRVLGAAYSNHGHEDEVLLPAGSRYRVVRHIDLPYAHDMDRVSHAHGVQVLQLAHH